MLFYLGQVWIAMVIFVMNLVKIVEYSFFSNIKQSIFGIFTLFGRPVNQKWTVEKYLSGALLQVRFGWL